MSKKCSHNSVHLNIVIMIPKTISRVKYFPMKLINFFFAFMLSYFLKLELFL